MAVTFRRRTPAGEMPVRRLTVGLVLTRLVRERHGGAISRTDTPDRTMSGARMTVSHLADAVAEGAGR
ncbi:hypothetical protein ACFYY3_23545 [Streptomyces sp. NPDC001812]|uniref:Uncharacterized protein n=1 Tax=Streptomyces cathayae TaxID=3031124 RepID=A0ABY8K905_9ACTN|nr:hypothetical protein [Streptomyces sp. HUAS 5]WGD44322.1 hypothetical protein PYS65_31630 [Streptomyces sp. HUAS 5]